MPYFVRIRGKAFGPFDDKQLEDMKTQGKLGKATEISENKVDWQPAETLEFLFPPSQQQSSGPPMDFSPSSGGQVYPSGGQVYGTQTPQEQADWYYSLNGTEGYGPLTAGTIEQMLRLGQLNANSYVWQQGQNARFIKNEPRFSGSGGGTLSRAPVENTGDMADIGGEITGSSEQVSTGKILRPMAASLGWLMFLKITGLIYMILYGLYLLLVGVFGIGQAVGANKAAALLVMLALFALSAGLYALTFKTFLCFWKYHTDLYQTVATGRASDLIQANQSQFLFWKWLGITVMTFMAITLVVITIMVILIGLGAGILTQFGHEF